MTTVVITRRRHPLVGQSLPELGRMRRHGRLELLLVLPDGSKALVPAAWTNVGVDTAGASTGGEAGAVAATLGSVADLLAACTLLTDLTMREPDEQGQAAGKSPCEEDSDAACPAQFDTRSAAAATGEAGRAAAGGGGRNRDHAAGRRDRQDRHPGRDRGGRR
jgi:hypothetical protein